MERVPVPAARLDYVLVLALGLALYLLTLAPTVLWGDDAELQRLAAGTGEINPGRGHAIWVWVARLFGRLPWGDPAWRASLVSALFGAAGLPLVYAIIRRLTRHRLAAILGAGALAVSHTYWLHSVRAEVYTLHLFLFAGVILLALRWSAAPGRRGLLAAAALLSGVGIHNHLLMAAVLPALVWLVWHRSEGSRIRDISMTAALILAGLSPALFLQVPAAVGEPYARLLSVFNPFTMERGDLIRGLLYTVYQFPLSVAAAAWGAVLLWRDRRPEAVFLVLAFTGAAGFAASFHVRDQYVFYLPAHLVAAIWVGAGLAELLRRSTSLQALSLAAVGTLLLPVVIYGLAPVVLERLDPGRFPVRELPGRGAEFFLWPPKAGYQGARQFAEGAFRVMPEGSTILADWTPAQTLLYMQEAEGIRRDILVKQLGAGWSRQSPFLEAEAAERPVFIADVDPRLYDIEEIGQRFRILPEGPVYRLVPPEAGGEPEPPPALP